MMWEQDHDDNSWEQSEQRRVPTVTTCERAGGLKIWHRITAMNASGALKIVGPLLNLRTLLPFIGYTWFKYFQLTLLLQPLWGTKSFWSIASFSIAAADVQLQRNTVDNICFFNRDVPLMNRSSAEHGKCHAELRVISLEDIDQPVYTTMLTEPIDLETNFAKHCQARMS